MPLHLLFSVVTWHNQLRGAVIVLVAVLVLPGSVYLLLATNTGAKLGFLLAVAGLSGWLFALNVVWLGYGIGYKGNQPTWVVKEIITGDLVSHSAFAPVVGTPGKPSTAFPNGWKYLPLGNSLLAPAGPVADKALIPPAAGAKPSSSFPAPFKTSQDYVSLGGWTQGGHNYLLNLFGYKVYWRIKHHPIFIFHQPHYLVVRVQPSLPSITLAGAAATLPAADVTQPLTSVVMVRDVGSLRLPPILIGLSALIVFGLTCERLHARDAEISRRKKEEEAGGGSGGSRRAAGELQPA